MTEQRVDVCIRKLVLNGIPMATKRHVGMAVERELASLLFDNSETIQAGISLSSIDAGAVFLRPGADGSELGVSIGRLVYRTFLTALRVPRAVEESPKQLHHHPLDEPFTG